MTPDETPTPESTTPTTIPTFPGAVRQLGHVVADLDASLAEWISLGVGPWWVIEVTQDDGRFRDGPSHATTSIGFANVGAMQIELIQAHGDGASIWHEARDLGRFGPHHLAYWTDDYDATMATIAEAGLALVQDGDGNGSARFAYVELATGSLIEVMELTELSRPFMDAIRESSEGWDGTRPVRR